MTTAHDTFSHEALLYVGPEDLIAQSVPFVREGVLAGEAVMVVLAAATNGRLADALGEHAEAVTFVDMGELGRNPARIIPAWRDFLTANEGRRVRGIGEPVHAGRGPDELVECQLHEALLNVAFHDTPGFRLLCPYDTESLPDAVVHEGRSSHPAVYTPEGPESSREYRGLDAVAAPFDTPLAAPTSAAAVLSFDRGSYRDVRALVVDVARQAGLTLARIDDLVLAVHELAANSVRHGGGRGVLRAWRDGDAH